MIIIGHTPEGSKYYNKFIAPKGEGLRGRICAMHKSKKKALIVCITSAFEDNIQYGDVCLVVEHNEDEWPRFKGFSQFGTGKTDQGHARLPVTEETANGEWEWVMPQVFHGKGIAINMEDEK